MCVAMTAVPCAYAQAYEDISVLACEITLVRHTCPQGTGCVDALELCQQLHTDVDEILERHESFQLWKFHDSPYTFFIVAGLHAPVDHHAAAAVQVAKDIRERLLKVHTKELLNLRMAIDSGSCATGVVGTHQFQFVLTGDAVDGARSLLRTVEAGTVKVTKRTQLELKLAGDAHMLACSTYLKPFFTVDGVSGPSRPEATVTPDNWRRNLFRFSNSIAEDNFTKICTRALVKTDAYCVLWLFLVLGFGLWTMPSNWLLMLVLWCPSLLAPMTALLLSARYIENRSALVLLQQLSLAVCATVTLCAKLAQSGVLPLLINPFWLLKLTGVDIFLYQILCHVKFKFQLVSHCVSVLILNTAMGIMEPASGSLEHACLLVAVAVQLVVCFGALLVNFLWEQSKRSEFVRKEMKNEKSSAI